MELIFVDVCKEDHVRHYKVKQMFHEQQCTQFGFLFVCDTACGVSLQNKSAFLCGVMKTYRQREKQGTKVSDSTKGPDEAKIKELLDRTNYTLDVTTGQRKYGGPPPEDVYSGAQPTVGTEVRSVCKGLARLMFDSQLHL